MGVAGEYLKAIVRHWKAVFLTLTALVAVANTWNKFQEWLELPWWAWILIVATSINVAQFLAWREIRRKWVESMEAQAARNKNLDADLAAIHGQLKALATRPASEN
jgi:hypothetical protein